MKVQGKLCLITGATYGLGKAIAYEMAKNGATLILLARTTEKLEEIKQDIESKGGTVHYYTLDLLSRENTVQTIETIKKELGTPDILVNNAAMGDWKFVENTDYEEFEIHMTVPYFSTTRMCRGFLKDMLEKEEAFIVNIVSGGDKARWGGAAAYLSARAAMTAFTEALGIEMWGTNVRVMLFSAGKIGDTNYFNVHTDSERRIPWFAKLIPTITSERAAKAIVKGVQKNKKEVFIPFMMRATYFFIRMFPRTMRWTVAKTGITRDEMGSG